MTPDDQGQVPPGWVGGFAESNPAFAYPTPDLGSLRLLRNMDNIDLLDRQMAAYWPEFSWQTKPGNEDSRCFVMFAHNISRIGYTNAGRVYSFICPQTGTCSPSLGSMNTEVTVLTQRGWVDEPSRTLAADMTVEVKTWFGPSAHQQPLVQLLWRLLADNGLPFPARKADAIRISTHASGNALQESFPVRDGVSSRFDSPAFTEHPEAWTVANVEVEMGTVQTAHHQLVDDFNQLVVDLNNMASGNMLASKNVLTWNVYFTHPDLVNREEWREHAEKWRDSIDADHGSPDGPGTSPRYADGTPFTAGKEAMEQEIEKITAFLRDHL